MAKTPDPDQPVSKAMLDEALNGVVDTLLQGMDNLYERFKGETDGLGGKVESLGGQVKDLKAEMNSRFDKVEGRLQTVEIELSYVKDEVNGLKAEFSTSPSRREFNELKERVDKNLPLS